MEKIVKQLNWCYYGVMVATLIVLGVMYYLFSKGLFEVIDPMTDLGKALQFAVYIVALMAIPFGLYLIKWIKPTTLERYKELAACRIFMIGGVMPTAIIFFYLLGGHRPLMWVAGMSAIAWYFTKPTVGKIEAEMTPEDPNAPTY